MGLFLIGSVHIIPEVFRTCRPFQSKLCEQFYNYQCFCCFSIFIYFLNLKCEMFGTRLIKWSFQSLLINTALQMLYCYSSLCPEKCSGLELLQTFLNGTGIFPAWDGNSHWGNPYEKSGKSWWVAGVAHRATLWCAGEPWLSSCARVPFCTVVSQLCQRQQMMLQPRQGSGLEGWSWVSELTEVLVHKMGWNY